MSFNDYWKKKAAKRQKTWANKAQGFAEEHTQLEDIRKSIFLPMDFKPGFNFDNYKSDHYIKNNPIAEWQQNVFSFFEKGLRNALKAEAADMGSFKMEVSRQSIIGKEAPQPANEWEAYPYAKPRPRYDYDQMYHRWLKRMYEICTDVEIVHLSYGQITMTIKRYSTEGLPFGYYELNPCEQLTKSAMLLQETDFYTLNIATFLMEMAAEWELRQDELNYYAKALKLRTMEAATTDSIDFELWDEKKLQKKIAEYVTKGYDIDKIIEQVTRPWKSAVKNYIVAATERLLGDTSNTFECFSRRYPQSDSFVEKVFQPYLESVNLQDVEIVFSEERKTELTLKYQGSQSRLWSTNYDGILLFPNSYYDEYSLKLLETTSLGVITDYLKVMPAVNQKMDETMVKIMHIFDEQMKQNPKYRSAVEHLEALQVQYAGKPVGRLMKYLRWRVDDLLRRSHYGWHFPISTVKILSDRSFCYQFDDLEDDYCYGKIAERWLDAECQTVYAIDPAIEDEEARKAALSPTGTTPRPDLWCMTRDAFVQWFTYPGFLSFDFIEQKL